MTQPHCRMVVCEQTGLRDKEYVLAKGVELFRVGDWIKFEQIGKIIRTTKELGSTSLTVTVKLTEDSYFPGKVTPQTKTVYDCTKCGDRFPLPSMAEDHYKSRHAPKPRKTQKAK